MKTAFVAGFSAPDPVSFLRLARAPFSGRTAEGETLQLLRVETDEAVDVTSITPHLGGASMRYNPLPPRMVSRRRRLGFIYFDGKAARRLSFAEAGAESLKALAAPPRLSGSRHFPSCAGAGFRLICDIRSCP